MCEDLQPGLLSMILKSSKMREMIAIMRYYVPGAPCIELFKVVRGLLRGYFVCCEAVVGYLYRSLSRYGLGWDEARELCIALKFGGYIGSA